jgi:predicted 3-demethylubiquinone-9 3-methyltransferase (glyoxalase superfamily)
MAGNNMQKITPFLWFNDKAEEPMNFYVSIFKNSKAGAITFKASVLGSHPGKVDSPEDNA